MSEDLQARLPARPHAPLPPLEATRAFLRSYAADADGPAEIHAEIARLVAVNPRSIKRVLEAIDALLATPPTAGVLAQLVAWDGNRVLADPSDEGAAAWLHELASSMRSVLGDQ